jgi:hypothetical protein
MQRTGQIWQIQWNGKSLDMIDHLLGRYPLRPLSALRFDPLGPSYPTTQFVFSRKGEHGEWSFVSRWKEPHDEDGLEFQRVELVDPTPERLAEYAGKYVSEELAANYLLEIREGRLWLRVNSRRWEQLDATVQDEFVPHLRDSVDGRIIRFVRDENNRVAGLTVDYYRVTGVRFDKR